MRQAMKGITILGSAALLALALVSLAFAAVDPPHGSTTVVDCRQCHDLYGQSLPDGGDPDNSPLNQLCRQAQCHGDGSPYAKLTHSSNTTSSDGTYGVWTQDCVDCHDPHTQRQVLYPWSYSASANPGGFIETGTVSSVVANVLTVSFHNTPQASDYWVGKVINVKGRYNRYYNYYISNYTSPGTVNVTKNLLNPATYGPYTSFGIIYGGLIKETINTRRPVANSSGVVFNSNVWRKVRFLNSSGNFSPGASLTDQQAICIVCHTRTKAFNIGYAQFGQNFDSKVDYYNQWHKDNVSNQATNCWSDTTGCHKEPKYGFDANCGGCHGQPPISAETLVMKTLVNDPWYTGRTQGAHQAHVNAGRSDCNYCHKGGGAADAGHMTQDRITMGFSFGLYQGGYTAGGTFQNTYTAASGATNTTVTVSGGTRLCDNIYCHSDGGNYAASYTFRQMNWDTAGSLACDRCHGDQAGKKVLTNVHPSHLNATSYNYSCYECHSATVDADMTIPAGKKASHINGSKNVSLANISAGGTYSRPNCSSAYCHSDGRGGAPMSAPAWNDANSVNGCNACHDAAGATTTQLSAAHAAHTNTSGNAYACTKCHSQVLSSDTAISNYGWHINQIKNVDSAVNYAGGGGSCSTTNCHGTASPAWTSDLSAYNDCTKCHGEKSASPTEAQKAPGGAGTDTSGVDNLATDAQVGAHQAHLKSESNYTVDVACSACHPVPANINDARHIDNSLPADVEFSSFVANYGGLTPTYSGGKCSNTYCHGAKMVNSTGQGADETPGWTNTTYLNGVPGITGDCDMCHASPPVYTGGAHSGSEGIAACTGCHTHFNSDGSLNNTLLHIDGIVQGAGCTGCHGQPPVDGPTMVNNPDYTGRGPGAHQTHYAKFGSCAGCHTGGGGSGHTTLKIITMGFNYGYQPGAVTSVFNAPALSNGYTLQSGYVNTATNISGVTRVCYSVYCHSDGGNYDRTSFTYRTPDWDGGSLACDACHGNQAGTKVITEVHPKHVTAYGYSCYECHANTVDADMTIPAGKEAKHVDSNKDVAFANLAAGGSYASRPSCTSITACHGDGTGGAPTNTPAWNNANSLPSDCTGCHKGTVASGSPMVSLRHTSHINNSGTIGTNIDCYLCHVKTTVTGAAINTISYHVNGIKNVTFTALNPGGAYDNGTKVCSTAYCHSDGNDASTLKYVSADWDNTAALDCKGCHGTTGTYGEPAYANTGAGVANSNSHSAHVSAAADCKKCHLGTTNDGTSITAVGNHINGTQDVAIDTPYDTNGGTSNWTAGSKQCSSVSCHGVGAPVWGGKVGCRSCHGSATADSDNFYWGGGSGAAAAIKTTGEWDNTGHGRPTASGNYPMSARPPAKFDELAGTGDGCLWCHSSGVAHGLTTNPFRLKQNNALGNGWNDACLYCHDSGQTSGTYDAGEGFTAITLSAVVKIDKYHQMAAHTQSGKNGGKFCWDCHDPHGDTNIMMIHAMVANATDGTYGNPGGNLANLVGPVVFNNNTVATGAGGYAMTAATYTQGVCNVCHSYRTASPKMVHYTSTSSDSHNSGVVCRQCHKHSANTTNDGDAFKGAGCNGCHAYPPTPGDLMPVYSVEGKGAHVAHMLNINSTTGYTLDPNADNFGDSKFNLTCGVCHQGATHETSDSSSANRTVVVNSTTYMLGTTGSASYNGAPGTNGATTPKTCSNVSCHYKPSPEWESY